MKIRLNKVQKELNIGLSTIVEFLQKKGFEVKEDPNAVVPEAGYEMLIQEFSADKKARKESDDFTKERLSKEKPKTTPAVEEKVSAPETIPEVKTEVFSEEDFSLIGEAFRTYILCEYKGKMVIIDKHAAHERILFEQIKKSAKTERQMLISSVSVPLQKNEYNAIIENNIKIVLI